MNAEQMRELAGYVAAVDDAEIARVVRAAVADEFHQRRPELLVDAMYGWLRSAVERGQS